eukprot:1801998-Amphidinium_carterae.1
MVGKDFPGAPFKLGLHLCVVRHAAFLQCLDCGCETGKVKGEYNFFYLKRQDCRKLKKKKVKVRLAGLLAPEVRRTDLDGGTTGRFFCFTSQEQVVRYYRLSELARVRQYRRAGAERPVFFQKRRLSVLCC